MTFDEALKAFNSDRAVMCGILGVSPACLSDWKRRRKVPQYVCAVIEAFKAVDRLQEELDDAQTTIRQLAAMLNK